MEKSKIIIKDSKNSKQAQHTPKKAFSLNIFNNRKSEFFLEEYYAGKQFKAYSKMFKDLAKESDLEDINKIQFKENINHTVILNSVKRQSINHINHQNKIINISLNQEIQGKEEDINNKHCQTDLLVYGYEDGLNLNSKKGDNNQLNKRKENLSIDVNNFRTTQPEPNENTKDKCLEGNNNNHIEQISSQNNSNGNKKGKRAFIVENIEIVDIVSFKKETRKNTYMGYSASSCDKCQIL